MGICGKPVWTIYFSFRQNVQTSGQNEGRSPCNHVNFTNVHRSFAEATAIAKRQDTLAKVPVPCAAFQRPVCITYQTVTKPNKSKGD